MSDSERIVCKIRRCPYPSFETKMNISIVEIVYIEKKSYLCSVNCIKTAMRRFVFILSLLAACVSATNASVVTYTPDNTTVFRNPERGFTEELSRKVSASSPNVVKGQVNNNWGSIEKRSMAMVLYNFNNFKAADLPDEVLAGFDEDMQVLRNCGLKCVLRFAYTESQSDKVDATPEWVKRHLEQLKPHLAVNADVIYVLEAGFVGSWGEWYYTTHYGNESQHMNANRRKVIQYLFENAPEDRFVLFRYPMLKTEYYGHSNPLPADEAFSGSQRARWGCHNDAFLNNWGNDGTYASDDDDDDPNVRQYIATETLYVPNGGETNVESNSLAEKVYTQAPSEMSKYHWSFCGSSYATQVTKRWRDSGIFDTLNVHMGYRYNLLEGRFSDEAAPGGKANVWIALRNSGYAPLYNERPVFLVLKNGSRSYSLPLSADPRRWLPNGAWSAIREQVAIPSDLPEGTYHLYLHLPDKYTSIASDPRYAVRLANKNVWDENTGLNDLGAEIVISASASKDPGPISERLDDAERQNSTDQSPRKIIENGIFYILMPDGKKYYCL